MNGRLKADINKVHGSCNTIKRSIMGIEESDNELTRLALVMFANWIETEDPLMSRNDAIKQKRLGEIKQLDLYQTERVFKLRKLAENYS